jgi:adenine phosphoribosyltransferase
MSSELLKKAAALLRPVPDFPIPGILFWDIAPLLRDPEVVAHLPDLMYERWKDEQIDVVAGFDARGFIFGPLLAQRLGVAFEQIRKPGKLPGDTISEPYGLEYGTDEVEMIDDGFLAGKRVLMMEKHTLA